MQRELCKECQKVVEEKEPVDWAGTLRQSWEKRRGATHNDSARFYARPRRIYRRRVEAMRSKAAYRFLRTRGNNGKDTEITL